MLLQRQITTNNPTAWLEQYAEQHPSSPNPTQTLLMVVQPDGTYDLRLVSYEPTRNVQRSRYYADAEAAIHWSPAVATPKMEYKALLKSRGINEKNLALALGYTSLHSMYGSQAYRKGNIFQRTLALANLFTAQPPSTL